MFPATHPPLSPSDRTLLTSYLAHDQNLPALATETQQDYLDLLTWLSQPHIRAFLDAHDHAAARADQATARSDRLRAATALRQAIEDADSPLERRRAATSLARTSTTRAPSWNRLREQSTNRSRPNTPSDSSRTLASAIQTLRRPLPPITDVDLERWLTPSRRDSCPTNGHTSNGAHAPNPPKPPPPAAPRPSRSIPQHAARAGSPKPETGRSVASPLYMDPIFQPIPRSPLAPTASILRAKSGAAPPRPPTSNFISWLVDST